MKLILSILLSLSGICTLAQQDADSSFVLIRTIEGDIEGAAMDNLDNLYIISSSGQLKKFNSAGDSAGIYNQVKNYGKLFSIDVSNPLKILLFYKDFSTIVVLDRFLAILATIDLRKYQILQAGSIGLSYDNQIWVFDEYDNKLKKIDEQGNLLQETVDLRTAINEGISPQKILNDDGFVYLADTTSGIFVFDNYGSFKRKIPLKNWESIAISKNNIISSSGGIISIYNPVTFVQVQRKNPSFTPYYHSFVNADKFVSFSPNKLWIYQYRF